MSNRVGLLVPGLKRLWYPLHKAEALARRIVKSRVAVWAYIIGGVV